MEMETIGILPVMADDRTLVTMAHASGPIAPHVLLSSQALSLIHI